MCINVLWLGNGMKIIKREIKFNKQNTAYDIYSEYMNIITNCSTTNYSLAIPSKVTVETFITIHC